MADAKKVVKKTEKKDTKKEVKAKSKAKVEKKTVEKKTVEKKAQKPKEVKKQAVKTKKVIKKEEPKKEVVKKVRKATKKKAPKKKFVQVKAKRKTAIARAVVKEGKGQIRINKVPYKLIENKYLRELLEEPLMLAEQVNKDFVKNVDININVRGGGQVSQIVAARGCIAKGLFKFYDEPKLKDVFNRYDNYLLVDDVRRKEPKKQLGRGARAKWQHSKR